MEGNADTKTGSVKVDIEQSLVKRLSAEPYADVAGNLKAKGSGAKTTIEDTLNAVLPPRAFIDEKGNKMMMRAAPTKSSREEVITLQMRLDSLLQERQARESGICPVREELYAQCFDELIRQVTVECPERGLLLTRIKDEISMTLAAHQTLYQGSIAFGMRKALQAEQGGSALEAKIKQLEERKKKLQTRLQQETTKSEILEKKISEKKQAKEKRMQSEKEFLSFQAKHLEAFLKSLK
uniref:33 kDa inner dynein arm light chain, axonemal n=1 Tax=Lotharella oceanica TaxID=641309 RepID=A0A7S2TP41_9EUKA